ncbi:MAG: amidohydrolase family protein [Bryobacterales bacterium]|nr:amidohydrolase family protein [Bryobacterales bacterium]
MIATGAFAQPLDLIVRNARIWTGDQRIPWADSMGISHDLVAQLNVSPSAAAPQVIDAKGRLIVPGFTDSHVHLISGGFRLMGVQLRDAKTKKEFVDRIAQFAARLPPGAWITGGDWDHENWGGELPAREWIDAVTPKNPVWVSRLDGHMGLANTAALKAAGVSARTREVPGGTIVKDAKGEPTGVLKDNAMEFIADLAPAPTEGERRKAIELAMQHLLSFGVTTAHHMGSYTDVQTFQGFSDQLKLRVYAAAQLAEHRTLNQMILRDNGNLGDRWLRWGLLKGFVDGSLGSHTAAFEQPYTDAPNDRGLIVTLPEQLYDRASVSYMLGLHVAIHAIGDRGNRLVLDTLERVAKFAGPGAQRARIEHAQHLRPEDIPRFAQLGVIASMQPYHLADDGRWAEKRIGPERAKTSYAFRSLLDAKVVLAFGSDWSVAPPNVMEGIWAAVTRQTLDGKHPNGWVPEQKITVDEALRAYTYGGAYAAYEESYKGKLLPKYLADFVVLDQDITKIAPAEIRNVKVAETWVGGKLAYRAK